MKVLRVTQDREDRLREAKATFSAWAEKKEPLKEDIIRKRREEKKKAKEEEEEKERKRKDAEKVRGCGDTVGEEGETWIEGGEMWMKREKGGLRGGGMWMDNEIGGWGGRNEREKCVWRGRKIDG